MVTLEIILVPIERTFVTPCPARSSGPPVPGGLGSHPGTALCAGHSTGPLLINTQLSSASGDIANPWLSDIRVVEVVAHFRWQWMMISMECSVISPIRSPGFRKHTDPPPIIINCG